MFPIIIAIIIIYDPSNRYGLTKGIGKGTGKQTLHIADVSIKIGTTFQRKI